jgi:hypothetical protein
VIKRKLEEERFGYGKLTLWDDDCYVFTIFLDASLFSSGKYDSPILRKIVGTHEFVHCVSTVRNLSRIKSKNERELLKIKLQNKLAIDILSDQNIGKIIKEQEKNRVRYNVESLLYHINKIIYDDEHYRLEDDGIQILYNELYDQLLFSRHDFERFIGENELATLKVSVKSNVIEAYKYVLRNKDRIAREKCLYDGFVVRRISEIISIYLRE